MSTKTDFFTGKFQFTFDLSPVGTVAIWGPEAVRDAAVAAFAREFNVHERQVNAVINTDDATGKVESITCRLELRIPDDSLEMAHRYFVDAITNLPIESASFGQWRRMANGGDGWVLDPITRTGH